MRGSRFGWMLVGTLAVALAGCQEQIDRLNPADSAVGARAYPTPHPLPVPRLQPAAQPEITLELDDNSASGDHLVIHNFSDGALYGLRVVVNRDYLYVMPVLQMGESVRVPDSYLKTEQGQPFPTDRAIRLDRVEVYYQGGLLKLFDRRGPVGGR